MKRSLKNILNLSLIVIMAGILVFTVISFKDYHKTTGSGHTVNNHEKRADQVIKVEEEDLTYVSYATYALTGFVLSFSVVYLIASRGNEKTMKETCASSVNLSMICVTTLCLTVAVTFSASEFAENKHNEITEPESISLQQLKYSGETIDASGEFSDGDYFSEKADENALIITGEADVEMFDILVQKRGNSRNTDNTELVGMNAGVIVKSGAKARIENVVCETNGKGADGIFCMAGNLTSENNEGDGSEVTVVNSVVRTFADDSAGFAVTGGGKLSLDNVFVDTCGEYSPAIRADYGGGKIDIDGGQYLTSGVSSPCIYSAADVTVKNAELLATTAEGIIIEGNNSVYFENVDLVDHNMETSVETPSYKNIFIYEPKDEETTKTKGTFTAKNSKITTYNGDTFYCTNTEAEITLEHTEVINFDSDDAMIRAAGDAWGILNHNGADVTVNLIDQELSGIIRADEYSTVTINAKENSDLQLTINPEFTAKSIKLVLDKTSKFRLTGDCYLTEFINEAEDGSNIDYNGFSLFVNGKPVNNEHTFLW